MIYKQALMALIIWIAGFTSEEHSQEVKVMTWNIRFDNPDDGENSWDARKENLVSLLLENDPDIFGIQEGLIHQVRYIDSLLPGHGYTGFGRDDGLEKGEYCAVFYKKNRFQLLRQGVFWLSETPGVPSRGWDAALNRICIYSLFETTNTGQQFFVFNTHLDHKGLLAREKSIGLICEKAGELNPGHLPVILMGDFNLEPGDTAWRDRLNQFADSRLACRGEITGPAGTFNAFRFDLPVTQRIDYIFISKGLSEVRKYRVIADAFNGRYPSDHFPVFADIMLR